MNAEHPSLSIESPFDLLCHYAEAIAAENIEYEKEAIDTSHLFFSAADEFFMLKLDDIRSVIRDMPLITKLPFCPPWLLGLSNVRSEIVTVISLADLLPGKYDGNKAEEFHYILLGGKGEGYMLRVGALYGINSVEGELMDADKKIIDGEYSKEGKMWQRISIPALLKHKLNMDVTKFN